MQVPLGGGGRCAETLPAFAEQRRWHRVWLQGQDARGRRSLGGAGPKGASGLARVPGVCLLGSGAEIRRTLSPAPSKPESHTEPSSRGQEELEPPLGLSLFSDKQPFSQDLLGF